MHSWPRANARGSLYFHVPGSSLFHTTFFQDGICPFPGSLHLYQLNNLSDKGVYFPRVLMKLEQTCSFGLSYMCGLL